MNVERTASEAIQCKTGLEQFVAGGKPTQTPLLSKMYLARSKLIRRSLEAATLFHGRENLQLLNLGGGLDIGYTDIAKTQFVVDLPNTLKNLPPSNQLPVNTHYITCNLEDTDALSRSLSVRSFDFNRPTIVLMECVLAYVREDAAQKLLRWINEHVRHCVFIAYDPICGLNASESKAKSFSRMMLERFQERKAPLLSVVASTSSYTSRMFDCDWPFVRTYTLSHALQLLLSENDATLYVRGELFDEYASLQTLLNLYGLCLAGNNSSWYQSWTKQLELQEEKPTEIRRRQLLFARIATLEAHVRAMEQRQTRRNQLTRPEPSTTSTSSYHIQCVQSADIDSVVALYATNFAPFAAADKSVKKYVTAATKQLQDLQKKLNPATGTVEVTAKAKATSMEHHLWVAKASSESSVVSGIIGVKRWKMVDPDAPSPTDRFEIVHFCVGGETRRQGVGSALLSEALQYCRREGASEASLTVLSSFTDARRLYEARGFTETGRDTLSPQCTMIHMQLTL